MTLLRRNSSNPPSWTLAELGDFYKTNRSLLHRHAARILKDSARAEEIVQEAMIRLMLAAPELDNSDDALAYLQKTVENLCIDVFRREGRRPNLVVIEDALDEIETNWQIDFDLSEILIAAEDAAVIREALSLLSPAERTALVMWEVEARSSDEIAETLGIKNSTVRHTVARARKSLRRVLTETIVDEERGLTAIDLLAVSYRKTASSVRSSSKALLSIAFLIFGILGLRAIGDVTGQTSVNPGLKTSTIESFASELNDAQPSVSTEQELPSPKTFTDHSVRNKVEKAFLEFPGLDQKGIPIGFSVSDSQGNVGEALFVTRNSISSNYDFVEGQIIKTRFNAANIFISQIYTLEGKGISYEPNVSFGRHGNWIPLLTRVTSAEISRLEGGNRLVTVYIAVDSEIESPFGIVSSAGGRDLLRAPKQIVTRFLLSEDGSQVISQAVFVAEEELSA